MFADMKRACWRRAVAGALALWSGAMPLVTSPIRTTAEHRCHHPSDNTPARHQPCDCCACGCVPPNGLSLTLGRAATVPASPIVEYTATPSAPNDRSADIAAQIVLPPSVGPPGSRL